eukprot:2422449-Rhodomonas_salina.1
MLLGPSSCSTIPRLSTALPQPRAVPAYRSTILLCSTTESIGAYPSAVPPRRTDRQTDKDKDKDKDRDRDRDRDIDIDIDIDIDRDRERERERERGREGERERGERGREGGGPGGGGGQHARRVPSTPPHTCPPPLSLSLSLAVFRLPIPRPPHATAMRLCVAAYASERMLLCAVW